MPFNFSPCVLYRGHIIFLWSKQCNDMKTIFFFGGGGGASQEDILGLAISLIFDQFSIL